MFQYLLRRLLIFIPTLFVISLVAFSLSKLAPGDPVELLIKGGGGDSGQLADLKAGERTYLETAERLGMNLPVFYMGLSSTAYPDTLYRITRQSEREALYNLTSQYGNWQAVSNYYKGLKNFETALYAAPEDSSAALAKRRARIAIKDLYQSDQDGKIIGLINHINTQIKEDSLLNSNLAAPLQNLNNAYSAIKTTATPNKLLIPSLKWYGFNNQYHRWISHFFVGDFGQSYLDNRPVSHKLWDALRWTLLLNFISIALAYILSIPLGVWTAVYKGSRFDRIATTTLFLLYSLPSFWIGTLLIVFFTTPEYGNLLDIFPPGGLTDLPTDAPTAKRWADIAYHLILPVLCITYGSLAFISRQMRGGMLNVIQQDYIRTARAKGLPENTIVWKHAFRNSLFPIITLFASVFPAAIAGSTVIEVIYSIPGMGFLAYSSIIARDWPVVFTILMFAAILTMIGNLVADFLYALADPRVSYK
jgi:peptide/nickel transport system permease protein